MLYQFGVDIFTKDSLKSAGTIYLKTDHTSLSPEIIQILI